MTQRIEDCRVMRSFLEPRKQVRSLQRDPYTYPQRAYNFRPTEQNRRKVPENKDPYRFNFGEWRGFSIDELTYSDCKGLVHKRFLADFVFDKDFDLAKRSDLVTAFRSLADFYYDERWEVGKEISNLGFTRTDRYGLHFWESPLSGNARVHLSCDETQYDQFIHVIHPSPKSWTRRQHVSFRGGEEIPDVTPSPASFSETVFCNLDAIQKEEMARFPVHISFHGMPVRLERLFIDEPDKKATYLTIAPLGFQGSTRSVDRYFYLTMRLNEEGREVDWAEKLLGLPFRFVGAYVNSKTEDLACAHFEPIQASDIEGGFRFEIRGTALLLEKYCIARVALDWGNDAMCVDNGSIGSLLLTYSDDDVELREGQHHLRGVITLRDNEKFRWREELLNDAVWRCCAFERRSTSLDNQSLEHVELKGH